MLIISEEIKSKVRTWRLRILRMLTILLLVVGSTLAQEKAVNSASTPDQALTDMIIIFSLHRFNDTAVAYRTATKILERYPDNPWRELLTSWVADYSKALRQYPNDLFGRAKVMQERESEFGWQKEYAQIEHLQSVLKTSVLEDVEERLSRESLIHPPNNIFPGAPHPAYAFPIDCLGTEGCWNAPAYTLVIEPVDDQRKNSAILKLQKLQTQPSLFGCYDFIVPDGGYGRTKGLGAVTVRCRFVRSVSVENNQILPTLVSLPKPWTVTLEGQSVKTVWLECGIRVDSKGIPLSPALKTSRPIAIETERNLYLVFEQFDNKIKSGAGHTISFKNKIFDVSLCGRKTQCTDTVMSNYVKRLRDTFISYLSAELLENEQFPKGEIWFGTSFGQSHVLGLPWYEVARYVVNWYGRDETMTWIDSGTGKGEAGSRYIFLTVEQEYTLSPNRNGTYKDARIDQEAEYKRAVNGAVRDALTKACTDLKSNMRQEVVDNEAIDYCSVRVVEHENK